MGVVTIAGSAGGLTRADLDAMPDDGRRYELIDGAIFVTPAPIPAHQIISGNLYALLRAACPADLRVLYAPVDVVLADDTVVEPDLVVARRSDFGPKDLPVPPALAVEILSPSTRLVDLAVKRLRYESAGIAAYWVVDPLTPSITAWELQDGAYVEVAQVAADATWSADAPFPVEITPARLLD
jgi:Uma2 family endonuclease